MLFIYAWLTEKHIKKPTKQGFLLVVPCQKNPETIKCIKQFCKYIYTCICLSMFVRKKRGSLPLVHRHQLRHPYHFSLLEGHDKKGPETLGLPRGCGDFRPRPGGNGSSATDPVVSETCKMGPPVER